MKWIRFTHIKENQKVLGIALDITSKIEEENRLYNQMTYDYLTGLYNRATFDQKISELFKTHYIGDVALVIWDIDNLRYINETYGHNYGDQCLKIFANNLSSLQNTKCLVCRLASDEFYSFFYGFNSQSEIKILLKLFWEKIQDMFIEIPNNEMLKIRVSAGISWYPSDANNQTDLIRYADFALYDVKHSFKGSMHDFDLNMYELDYILLEGTAALNEILDNNLIEYALQPIVAVATGDIYGYEMLMRCTNGGLKNPENILRLAREQSKLHIIEEITMFKAMETFTNKIKSGEIKADAKVFLNTINSQNLTDSAIAEFEERYRPNIFLVLELWRC